MTVNGFEHYARNAEELEREILKRGLALRLDWDNASNLRLLAREALRGGSPHIRALLDDPSPRLRAKGELFALAVLMMTVMKQSAAHGIHTHGGPAWKALGRALLAESEAGAAESGRVEDGHAQV